MFRVSFVVEDRRLGEAKRALASLGAREVTDIPLLNAELVNGEIRPRAGSAAEAFVQEMHKRKLDEVTPSVAKDIVKAIGFSPSGYYHILATAVKHGLMHKGGKAGGMGSPRLYIITKRIPHHKGGK